MRKFTARNLLVMGSILALAGLTPVQAQLPYSYATPLPPGPGSVPLPIPAAPMAAPVLMPLGAPTAAPVGIYQYPTPALVAQAGSAPAPGQFYGSAEFLYGASQGTYLPPLVTAAPPQAPVPPGGSLYNPNSTVLFGGRREGNTLRPGFKLNVGYLFGPDQVAGIDAGFFFLGGLSEKFTGLANPGVVRLARPLVSGNTQMNTSTLVGGAMESGGIFASNDTFTAGADVNYRRALLPMGGPRFDLLVGYKYMHVGDSVDVWESRPEVFTTRIPGTTQSFSTPTGSTIQIHDSFRTQNHFHGPQIGVHGGTLLPWGLSVDALLKLGMGVTVASAQTNGLTQIVPPGTSFPTGLLVQDTNTVANQESYFAVVPEVGVNLGYNITPNMKVNLGYTMIYWSKVRRAADQIDLTAFSTGRPAFLNRTGDFWVQGWSLGLNWAY